MIRGSTVPLTLPPGELFDHGLDSWSAIFLPMTLVSFFGRNSETTISVTQGFWPCLSALGGFYVSHWEKYITGVMYLPWLYDFLQLVYRLGEGGRERGREKGGRGWEGEWRGIEGRGRGGGREGGRGWGGGREGGEGRDESGEGGREGGGKRRKKEREETRAGE